MQSENPFPSQNNGIFLAVAFSPKQPVSLVCTHSAGCLQDKKGFTGDCFPFLSAATARGRAVSLPKSGALLKCLFGAKQMFTFPLGQSCFSGLLCQGDEG